MTTDSETKDGDARGRTSKSNRLMLCIAWVVVGIPLAWGVFKSVEKSLPLFCGRSPAAQVPRP